MMNSPIYEMVLCLDCEEKTGERSVRFVTRQGCCFDCGSKSVLSLPKMEMPKREQRDGDTV